MPSTTLATLQSRIYSRLDGNTNLYPASELANAINEQIRLVNLVTGYIQGTASVTTTANTFWYTTPTSVVIPTRIQWNGVFIEKCSLNGLGLNYPNMLTDTTANTGLPVSHWACSGLRTFAIHPADSIAGNTLVMTGIIEPTLLVSAGDTIQLPDEYTELLEDMSVISLTLKEGAQIFQQSMLLYKRVQSRLAQFSRWETYRQPSQRVEVLQAR